MLKFNQKYPDPPGTLANEAKVQQALFPPARAECTSPIIHIHNVMFRRISLLLKILTLSTTVLLSACGGGDDDTGPKVASKPQVVVAFGDSLTSEEFFITPGAGWVNLLKQRITADGVDAQHPVSVINEGRGGETTVQALSRLPGILATYKPTHILLAHGTNDILWYCPGCFAQTQANLKAMADTAKAAGVKVIFTDITLRIRGQAEADAYSAMVNSAAAASGSEYTNLVADVAFDNVNYHPDKLHLTDAAQPAMSEAAARALYRLID